MHGNTYLRFKTRAFMRTYNSSKQLTFEGFDTPFERNLLPTNRWVKLAHSIPWDECVGIYLKSLSSTMGRPAINARLALGSMLIKHVKGLSDREVIEAIQENIYLQYFVGFCSFNPEPAFDPSLMVTLRERMGEKEFDKMNDLIIQKALGIKKTEPKASTREEENEPKDLSGTEGREDSKQQSPATTGDKKGTSVGNKGKLKLDATVADQMIVYPTDLNLLNTAREESERLIDQLFKKSQRLIKPRTYRQLARKRYLKVAKKKQKTKREIRKAIGQQLRYLKRNINTINTLWDETGSRHAPFTQYRDLKIFWVIQLLYEQQNKMYEERTNRHSDRIVNIYQPYVRPILRGKEKHKVEFGSKIGVSEFDGFARLDHLSWNAYNECSDLITQVERYRILTGYYPEVVMADQIYMTRKNRKWLKERNIRHIGKPLGKPKKLTPYQKRKQRKERNMRNHIEGKFGQAKNAYELNRIRARRADTSQSWIACIVVALNLVRWVKIMPVILLLWQFFICNALNFVALLIEWLVTPIRPKAYEVPGEQKNRSRSFGTVYPVAA